MAISGTIDAQDLLRQLAEGREQLRAERATLRPKLEEADRMHREAETTLRRVRKSAARYLQRSRRKAHEAMAPLRAAHEELARQQAALRSGFSQLASEREQFQAEMNEVRDSLKASWELLEAQRRQFATERDERDAELSRLFQLLEAREQETRAASEKLQHDRHKTETELSTLRAEIAGLDRRVANARVQLQEFEQSRAKSVVDRVVGFNPEVMSIPLVSEGPSQQLTAIEQRETALIREQRELDARRRELDRLAEHLSDGRRVLLEQIEQVAIAREAWQSAESRTVDELEELAKAVEFREAMMTAREAALARQEENRRERERELWKYQTTLDQWHELLTERESRFLADREQSEVGLAARRGLLADREAGLDALCQKWEADHSRLREEILDAIAGYREQSDGYRYALSECEQERRQTLEQAAKLAAWLMAAEQQYAESAGHPEHAKASRRIAALRKRWESRFARTLRQFDERLAKLHAESAAITARQAELHRLAADVTERQRQLILSERRAERDWALSQKLPPDQPIVLSVADGWRRRSDAEIEKLRRAAALSADALIDIDAKNDIVPLRAADAA